jgi:ABC-type Fe3+ transport system permease subunit
MIAGMSQPSVTPVIPEKGWHVLHLFYRIEHGQWAMLTNEVRIAAIEETMDEGFNTVWLLVGAVATAVVVVSGLVVAVRRKRSQLQAIFKMLLTLN